MYTCVHIKVVCIIKRALSLLWAITIIVCALKFGPVRHVEHWASDILQVESGKHSNGSRTGCLFAEMSTSRNMAVNAESIGAGSLRSD